ncbi:hypothetical protein ACTNIH_002002 [Vibrio parahaemolyticus]|uniref:hypothetical protein n=1 Tax=Vibrio vulnificus TaxID=672 RepID=UPI000CCFD9EE|nr:hypothetical protein [Vibrio vulnificus]EGQ8485945.1 hypothetical protein [Vibrio parahaemolyticus]HDU8576087.1 hypothetical protein [Vibrio diabolicus]EGQ9705868.1 hypothetical protein [Vibrio parahaemolyticus]EGR1687696.1 hypothetical protein [Vibrio parahaemolyticus]EHH0804863.1 hypothetical protein [Vibrio vulnificus]
MKSGTPSDYSEDMYKVYFEVGEWEGTALGIIESFVGHSHSKNITHLEFGYELAMPIQCVPDLVRLLNEKNIAIYQVVRGEKTEASWR